MLARVGWLGIVVTLFAIAAVAMAWPLDDGEGSPAATPEPLTEPTGTPAATPNPSPTASRTPEVQERTIVLAPGGWVEVTNSAGVLVRLTMDGVVEDSRCPSNVRCIRAGEAVVALTAQSGGLIEHVEIPFGESIADDTAVMGGLEVTVLAVEPEPTDPVSIDPDDYEVTLRIAPAR